ncbi:MAG: COR domain-containing protein, partial [Bacteroidota bacterium]
MSQSIARDRIHKAIIHEEDFLDLSGLGLKRIPETINNLPALKLLNLNDNELEDISVLEPLNQLQVISLNENRLSEVPGFLCELEVPIRWGSLHSFSYISFLSSLLHYIHQCLTLASAKTVERERKLVSFYMKTLDINMKEFELFTKAQGLVSSITYLRDLNRATSNAVIQKLSKDTSKAKSKAQSIIDEPIWASHLSMVFIEQLTKDLAYNRWDFAQEKAIKLSIDLVKDILSSIRTNLTSRRHTHLGEESDMLSDFVNALLKEWNEDSLSYKDAKTYLKTARKRYQNQRVILQERVFDKIQGIYLLDNPFIAPPPEIIAQGTPAVKTFLHDFMRREILNEVKVILVGEGSSGKTSLVKRLLGQNFDRKEKQTHGIKISRHEFQYKVGQKLRVNFWDFGGQEIMHATHQFFLTKRCLYILVLDSRRDEKAEFWLKYIQSFGGDAPVLIVLNKNDENPSFDVNRGFLIKRYPNIRKYFKVSCLENYGVRELRDELKENLWNLELRKTAFPKGWFRVKKGLEKMTEDYINYATYQAICDKNHVQPAAQKVLLDLLNDLGVVLNYEKLRWYNTQVLNPLWLTNAVYRIINSPILVKSNGRFNINDLDSIINDARYQKENPEHWTNIFKFWKPEEKLQRFPEEKFLFIVAMMKEFELVYQIDEFHYIIPGLLNEEE